MAAEHALEGAATPVPAPPADFIDYDKFVTEDDTPLDGFYEEKQQRLLVEPLYSSWTGPGNGRPYLAARNVGVFYGTQIPPVVPDAFLSADVTLPADVWRKQGRSYFVWLYGKPPDVVVEVVSNTEGEELGRKLGIYARVGAPYYIVWDPERIISEDRLQIFALQAGAYQKQTSSWFANLNLGVKVWTGAFEGMSADWLRWCDAAGTVLACGAELKHIAEKQVEQAEERAKNAEQALLKSRRRSEKLANLLRSQGLEPPENGD